MPLSSRKRAAMPIGCGLTGFLVVAMCNFHDVPLALYADQGTAVAHAKRLRTLRRSTLRSRGIHKFISVKVFSFKDGRPQRLVLYEKRFKRPRP
jgi:hypothetical protein